MFSLIPVRRMKIRLSDFATIVGTFSFTQRSQRLLRKDREDLTSSFFASSWRSLGEHCLFLQSQHIFLYRIFAFPSFSYSQLAHFQFSPSQCALSQLSVHTTHYSVALIFRKKGKFAVHF